MNVRSLRLAVSLALPCLLAAGFSAAATQTSYPTHPVTLVVPFPPGGATDVGGRVIAQALGKELGQSVVVENRAGAGTVIGASYVARSAPDGYTLLITSGTTFTVNPAVRRELPYDPVKSFEPIGVAARTGLILLAYPKVPVSDVKSFLAYVNDPSHASTPYGSFGSGTTANFVGEAFAAAAGITLTHVAYKGSAPAMADLIGGQIPFSIDTVSAALPQLKNGKVKAIAVSSPRRSAFLPDVPTFAESGYPQVAMDTWLMVAAPRGLPAEVQARLGKALADVMADPDVRRNLLAQGFEPGFEDAEQSEALIRKELPQMREIAERAHIKAD